MATKSFDFSTMEGRQKIWEDLIALEGKNRKTIRIAKIKNFPVALTFMLNVLLYMAYLSRTVMATDGFEFAWLCGLPVVGNFFTFASGYTGDGFWKCLFFGIVFLAFVPMILGKVLDLILSMLIPKEKIAVPALPEKESEQFDAILNRHKAVQQAADSYSAPYGMVFGTAILAAIGFSVLCVVEWMLWDYSLGLDAWIALILVTVGLGIFFGAMAFCASFGFAVTSSSKTNEEWEQYSADLEKEKAKREQEEKETRKRLQEEEKQRAIQAEKKARQERFDRAVQCIVERNYPEARRLSQPLAEERLPEAMVIHGLAWYLGQCEMEEYPQILALLEDAKALGIPEGTLREQCDVTVAQLREACEPAARSTLEAALELTYNRQHTKALPLLKKAAALGSAEALIRYVDIKYRLENGVIPQQQMLEQDIPQYIQMLRKAQNWGFENVESANIFRELMPHLLTRLGLEYMIKKQKEEGTRLLQEAANMGHKQAIDILHPPKAEQPKRRVCFYNNRGICTKNSTEYSLHKCPPDGVCSSYRPG